MVSKSTPKNPKRLLVLTYQFPAISETFVVDHIRGLLKAGWQVAVARLKPPPFSNHEEGTGRASSILPPDMHDVATFTLKRQYLSKSSISIISRLRADAPLNLRSIHIKNIFDFSSSFSDLVRNFQPAVIHAHFGSNALIAAYAARKYKIPLLVDFHGTDVFELPSEIGWRPYQKLLSGCIGIAHSIFIHDILSKHLNIPINMVRLGVDRTLYSTTDRPRNWPYPLKILAVGRLLFKKGFHVAIEALAILRRLFPNINPFLSIVGDGPEHQFLRSLSRFLQIDKYVSFLGSLTNIQVAASLASSDILIVPSVRSQSGSEEGFGRVAIEGMSSGLPVFVSDCGGLPETVGNPKHVFTQGDPLSIAILIAKVHSNFDYYALCQSSVQRSIDFSIERMWREYETVTYEAAGF